MSRKQMVCKRKTHKLSAVIMNNGLKFDVKEEHTLSAKTMKIGLNFYVNKNVYQHCVM